MSDDWKSVFYEYIRQNNELETEATVNSLSRFVEDEQYLSFQRRRVERVAVQDERRKLQRKKNELRLKILEIKELASGVIVECQMRKRFDYFQKHDFFQEERIERQRLYIVKGLQSWFISSIEPMNEEQSLPYEKKRISPSFEPPSTLRMPSKPFLNPLITQGSEGQQRKRKYDREVVKRYADTWWDFPNPEYIHFHTNCTNFVSQSLYAGGAPMDYTNSRENGWWYRSNSGEDGWSFSWSVAHSLHWYLANPNSVFRSVQATSPEKLTIGDVILYDWEGNGNYQHSTIVTAKDADGMPLVNANTSNSKRRFWDYQDSYAWTDQTKYRLFHISDEL